MSSSENNVEVLTNFGLTRNQAKVYLTIAGLGLATVGKTSKISKVRREDVYRMLPKLEEMGLVERLLGKPIKIRATPVEEALSILIKQEEKTASERMTKLKDEREKFLKDFTREPIVEFSEKAHFALLSKPESVTSKMLVMMEKAEKEVGIVFSRRQLVELVHAFAEEIKKTVKKAVRIRVISEVPDYEDSLPKIMEDRIFPGDSIDLRYADFPSSHYILVDFKEALISTATQGNIAQHPCLWTNSESLVGVFQGDFENLWHNSTSWKNIETTSVLEKVTGFMEQLSPTNHVIFIYDKPEAKYNVLFNFLKVGLENGEAGVYVASEEKPSQIREALKQFGVDVEKYENTGALHIYGYEEIYIIDGRFDITTTISLWNRIYNEAIEHGFKGLRVTGETAFFFKDGLVMELLEYEKALHSILDIPMIAVCAYNSNLLDRSKNPINLFTELCRAHGTTLFTGFDNKLGRMEIR